MSTSSSAPPPGSSSFIIPASFIQALVPAPPTLLQPGPVALPTALALHKNHAFYEYHDIILGSPSLQSGDTVTTNIVQTIWVQDQPFVNWTSVWSWMHGIKCEITCKAYPIDLVQQKIRMENVATQSSEQINNLMKRDWVHMH